MDESSGTDLVRRVPLAIYQDGHRKVIGNALVYPDGAVYAQITDEKILTEAYPEIGEFSFRFTKAFDRSELKES